MKDKENQLSVYFVWVAVMIFFSCHPQFSGDSDKDAEPVSDSGALDAGSDASLADSGLKDSGSEIPYDPDCPNPAYPVDCEDGVCWPAVVDCSTIPYECGGALNRCLDPDSFASCCDGAFNACSWNYPWFCPTDSRCYQREEHCPLDADAGVECEYRGEPCS